MFAPGFGTFVRIVVKGLGPTLIKSLFLPRVEELVRIDKTEADTLEKILKG